MIRFLQVVVSDLICSHFLLPIPVYWYLGNFVTKLNLLFLKLTERTALPVSAWNGIMSCHIINLQGVTQYAITLHHRYTTKHTQHRCENLCFKPNLTLYFCDQHYTWTGVTALTMQEIITWKFFILFSLSRCPCEAQSVVFLSLTAKNFQRIGAYLSTFERNVLTQNRRIFKLPLRTLHSW